jgi:hypothetical protein
MIDSVNKLHDKGVDEAMRICWSSRASIVRLKLGNKVCDV